MMVVMMMMMMVIMAPRALTANDPNSQITPCVVYHRRETGKHISAKTFKAGLTDAGILLSEKDFDSLLHTSTHYSQVSQSVSHKALHYEVALPAISPCPFP